MALDEGWVYFDTDGDNFQIRCESWDWDWDDDPIFTDFAGDGHFSMSTTTYVRKVMFTNIWFTSTADYEDFLDKIHTLQTSGPAWKLKIKTSSTHYFAWNGTNIEMPVSYKSAKGMTKPTRGEGEFWEIPRLVLRQGGSLSGTN